MTGETTLHFSFSFFLPFLFSLLSLIISFSLFFFSLPFFPLYLHVCTSSPIILVFSFKPPFFYSFFPSQSILSLFSSFFSFFSFLSFSLRFIFFPFFSLFGFYLPVFSLLFDPLFGFSFFSFFSFYVFFFFFLFFFFLFFSLFSVYLLVFSLCPCISLFSF